MATSFGYQMVTFAASAARTTTGTGTGLTGRDSADAGPAFGEADRLRALLLVTAASGTTPTLDVVLEDSLDGGTTWTQIGAFAQKTAAGNEAINVTIPFGPLVRARWTIAGTTPSFTFAVTALIQ